MPLPSTPPFSDLASLRGTAAALLRLGRFGGLSLALLLVGCASGTAKTTPRGAPLAEASGPSRPAAQAAALPRRSSTTPAPADGPGREPAPDLATLADAEPVVETIRGASGNRPYTVMGRSFVPQTEDRPHRESGLASWYGRQFHGRRTASGEVYDMHAMTAAHPTLPLPSYVRVRNPSNGTEVVVRVNDRGPFHRGRIIDLSYAAARKLGVAHGVGRVEIDRLTFDEIRTGAWRRAPAADGLRVAQLASKPAALPAAETSAPAVSAAPEPLPGANPPGLEPSPRVVAAAEPVGAVALPVSGAATPVIGTSRHAPADPAPVVAALPSPVVAAAGPEATPPPTRPSVSPSGFWVQLGVFKLRDGAEHFHRRVVADLHWLAPVLAVLSETEIHRLQAGPYRSRDEAHGVAQRVRDALSLVPMVVERY